MLLVESVHMCAKARTHTLRAVIIELTRRGMHRTCATNALLKFDVRIELKRWFHLFSRSVQIDEQLRSWEVKYIHRFRNF